MCRVNVNFTCGHAILLPALCTYTNPGQCANLTLEADAPNNRCMDCDPRPQRRQIVTRASQICCRCRGCECERSKARNEEHDCCRAKAAREAAEKK